jgi:hypothetical protein
MVFATTLAIRLFNAEPSIPLHIINNGRLCAEEISRTGKISLKLRMFKFDIKIRGFSNTASPFSVFAIR